MESLVDKIIEIEYSDLDEYIPKFPINKRFGLVVHLNNNKYEFLLNLNKSSDAILVLAPPAIEGEHLEKFRSRPYFSRQSWDFKESTIYFEDPTRYVYSLKSGWGIGTPNEWFLDNIKNIILKISHFFGIPNEKLIFFGSSSGGFTSIQLATLVEDSLAVADCPQTDLRKWRYYWKDLKRTIFNQLSDEEINSNFDYRVSVIDNMIKENYVPNLLFISTLNENDIVSQTVPFIQQLYTLPFKGNSFSKIKILINPVDFHGPIYKVNAFKLLENIDFCRNKEEILDLLYGKPNHSDGIKHRLDEIKRVNYSEDSLEPHEISEAICFDNATSDDYNDIWSLNGTASLIRGIDGTVMTGGKWASINLKANNNINFAMGDYVFEFDVIYIIGNNARLNFYDGSSNQMKLSKGHYKVEITDKVYVKKDNIIVNIISHDTKAPYFQLNFNITDDDVILKLRNIRLHNIKLDIF